MAFANGAECHSAWQRRRNDPNAPTGKTVTGWVARNDGPLCSLRSDPGRRRLTQGATPVTDPTSASDDLTGAPNLVEVLPLPGDGRPEAGGDGDEGPDR